MLDLLRPLLSGHLDMGGFAILLGIVLALFLLSGLDAILQAHR